MDMKDLIRKRLGLTAPAGPTAEPTKPEGGAASETRKAEGGSEEEVSVCDCGRCQEYTPAKRPPTAPAASRGGRGQRGGGRGGPPSAGPGRGGNPWGGQQADHARRLGQRPEEEEHDEGSNSTTCASCGCDIICHVVPGQLEDEDGFEDDDYDPVYGEHD